MVGVVGESGSGKSVTAIHFIGEGIRQGEPGVILVFEEHPQEYLARAKELGFDLGERRRIPTWSEALRQFIAQEIAGGRFGRPEEIGSVVTDECGRFCVWIPRWEIDWILRFRHIHICLPDIFLRPRLRDLLDDLRQQVPVVRPPRPEPDPHPWLLRDGGQVASGSGEAGLGRY